MRGKLIFPFLASIARIDYAQTAADPDAGGALTTGYDPDFREPVVLQTGSTSTARKTARKELTPILLPVQVETNTFELLQQFSSGNSPGMRISLIFHFRDLENKKLVDPDTGSALLRVGDRLDAIHLIGNGKLLQKIRNPPGLFAIETSPIAFGLGNNRNLLQMIFSDREQGLV